MVQGYTTKEYKQPIKRYCQSLELKNNADLIKEYKLLHSKEQSWKEIREGIKSVGILEMEIYILDNKLFMIVETPIDFDWESSMKKLSTLPRQKEWETLMDKFQNVAEGKSSNQKWEMMERMFYLYD